MKTKQVITAASALAFSSVLILSGCSAGGDDGSSANSGNDASNCTNTIKKDDLPVVTMWAWYPNMELVVDNFNEQSDDVQVLSVSIDSPFAHKVWAQREGFEFPLLSDFWPHGEVAQAYGVFNEEKGMANRGTFVIDKQGVVRFAEMNMPGEARDQGAWQKALSELA